VKGKDKTGGESYQASRDAPGSGSDLVRARMQSQNRQISWRQFQVAMAELEFAQYKLDGSRWVFVPDQKIAF